MNEVGTYLGFAIRSMMSVSGSCAFQDPTLVWGDRPGRGLRMTLELGGIYDKVLDRWLAFTVAGRPGSGGYPGRLLSGSASWGLALLPDAVGSPSPARAPAQVRASRRDLRRAHARAGHGALHGCSRRSGS